MRVLSLGAGVQSSTIVFMMEHGEIEKADLVIFADTGDEPAAVYRWLDWMEERMTMPLQRVIAGEGLKKHMEAACSGASTRCSQPPLFTGNGGRIFRKCTQDFKIAPIKRALQAARNGQRVVQIFGISFDERHRARTPDAKYIERCEHPLIDLYMTRADCKRWMVQHGYPIPPRSACLMCPNRCNTEWQLMRDMAPEDWEEACRLDDLMRNAIPGLSEAAYIHRQCVPLREADLYKGIDPDQLLLNGDGWADCEGMCGV